MLKRLVLIEPGILVAEAGGTRYKATDGGSNWAFCNNGSTHGSYRAGDLIGEQAMYGNLGYGNAYKRGDWDNSKFALDIGGEIFGAMEGVTCSQGQWVGTNGKYYSNSWGGNQYTGSRSGAFKAAGNYKLAGRVSFF